ncbi:MAG: multiple sugar transport system permease protein [Candidatus Sumerlaeota bacterium]|nr:multiple sugar transport system permease protein [Candidatus Sumerlaeota bacterium]
MSTSSRQHLKPHEVDQLTVSLGGVAWFARHMLICFAAFLMALPFVWMVFGSFKSRPEAEQVHFVPKNWQPENYAIVLRLEEDKYTNEFVDIQFGRFYFNSVWVTLAVVLLQLVTCAMAAYAFARVRWPGRDKVFFLYLGTLMIPGVVLMIPNFQTMVAFHMIDTYRGLIIPAAFAGSAFGTFLLRQFMLTIPRSLDEAAAIDGASHWHIFWDLILPLTRAGLVTLGIFAILSNYQSFFWPLVMLKTQALYTLPIGLLEFDTSYGKQTELILAATVMSTLPLILIFVFAQKAIVKGIQLGAVKG